MSSCDYIIGNTSIILWDAPIIYVWVSITDLSNLNNASRVIFMNHKIWYQNYITVIKIFLVKYTNAKLRKENLIYMF